MGEMVDRVQTAIELALGLERVDRSVAEAAIAAMRHPTPDMASIGRYAIKAEQGSSADSEDAAINCWHAMVDMALKTSGQRVV